MKKILKPFKQNVPENGEVLIIYPASINAITVALGKLKDITTSSFPSTLPIERQSGKRLKWKSEDLKQFITQIQQQYGEKPFVLLFPNTFSQKENESLVAILSECASDKTTLDEAICEYKYYFAKLKYSHMFWESLNKCSECKKKLEINGLKNVLSFMKNPSKKLLLSK